MKDVRVVVGGFLGLWPAGGPTWDYVQYPLGLAELGADVYYVEDTRLWPVYRADAAEDPSARPNVEHLAKVMEFFGLGDRWAYRDEISGEWFGMSGSKVAGICRTADVLVNVSCSIYMRDEYRRIPVRILIDSDPMFTQIQYAAASRLGGIPGEPGLREMLEAHTHHFSFGEHIGAEDCRVPTSGITWRPTRQPICLDWWPVTPLPEGPEAAYTTVMNWTNTTPLEWNGDTWGQKDVEMLRFQAVPSLVRPLPIAVAVGQSTESPFPTEEFEKNGWRVLDPAVHAPEWVSYREFIGSSLGEFAIAKETYVKALTGWFSCRAACYLAAGRPVVNQDTGWSRHLPAGEGLLAFDDVDGAVAALREVASDPGRHARAARRIAEECFDARAVLTDLLERAGTKGRP